MSGIVDCAVHPYWRHSEEIRSYLPEPWRSKRIAVPFRSLNVAPTGHAPYGEFREDARPAGVLHEFEDIDDPVLRPLAGGAPLPGSDPELAWTHLAALGVTRAVLTPLTRGLQPEADLGSAICTATNEWLAATWLVEAGERFLGSIRVNPSDPVAAAAEIERWAAHPRMAQVALPLFGNQPYGQRSFWPIWEAAARHELPVAIVADGGTGIEFPPTPAGYPRHHVEFAALYPLAAVFHLMSFIAAGTFERIPRLRVLFVDGGYDMLLPALWKMDTQWPMYRRETPWIVRRPSKYLREHVRFCASPFEGPRGDPAALPDYLELSDAREMLLFGSRYPHWSSSEAAAVAREYPEGARSAICGNNAAAFYRLN